MLGNIARTYAVTKIVPYVQQAIDLLEQSGIGEQEILCLVETNKSFYSNFVPPAWKQALPILIEEKKGDFAAYVDVEALIADPKTYLALFLTVESYKNAKEYFFEAVRQVAPWLEGVLLSTWFEGELVLISEDLKARATQAV